MDQQVVRAALKSYRTLFSAGGTRDINTLSPSSYYLRHLVSNSSGGGCPASKGQPSDYDWSNPATSIHLLELRAAFLVQAHAQILLEATKSKAKDPNGRVDASANQRISKAVTEAFVAARVGEMIDSLKDNKITAINKRSQEAVKSLFVLVSIVIIFKWIEINIR